MQCIPFEHNHEATLNQGMLRSREMSHFWKAFLAKPIPVLFRGVPGNPPPGGAPHEAQGAEDVEYGLLWPRRDQW